MLCLQEYYFNGEPPVVLTCLDFIVMVFLLIMCSMVLAALGYLCLGYCFYRAVLSVQYNSGILGGTLPPHQ
jgi:hypothetical protein